jgi:hypothetical protein
MATILPSRWVTLGRAHATTYWRVGPIRNSQELEGSSQEPELSQSSDDLLAREVAGQPISTVTADDNLVPCFGVNCSLMRSFNLRWL